MKITAEKDILAPILSSLEAALDRRIIIPTLACVQIEGQAGKISLMAHSLSKCMQAVVMAEVSEPSTVCVPLSQLASIVAGSPKGSTITIDCEVTKAAVKVGRSRYQLPILVAADFPAALAPDGKPFDIETSALLSLIDNTAYAMADDISRPLLSGLSLYRRNEVIAVIGANGQRMAQAWLPDKAPEFPNIIIPNDAVADIKKFATGDKLSLNISNKLISVTRADGAIYTTKLIDGEYPAYDKAIPELPPNSAKIDRDELLSALHRLEGIMDRAKDIFPTLNVSWAEGQGYINLNIQHTFSPLAEGTEQIEGEIIGQADFRMNIGYASQAADHLDCDQLEIRIDNSRSPIFILSPANDSVRAIVQPIAK